MTELQHDRVPDQTLTRRSATEANSPAAAAVLSVRLWTAVTAGNPDEPFAQAVSAPVFLLLDMIAASGGTSFEPAGSILSAHYPDPQSAILAARRLQWAMQGLAESEAFRETAVTVLVHSSEPAPDLASDGTIQPALENASPGLILLSESLGSALGDLPGLDLRPGAQSGIRELVWRDAEAAPDADESALLLLMQQAGLEDPAPPGSFEPAALPPPSFGQQPPEWQPGADAQVRSARRSESSSFDSPGSPNWIMWGGIAAAALVVAVVLFLVIHRKAPPVAATTAGQTTLPVTPTAPTVPPSSTHSPAPVPPKPPKNDAKNVKPPVADHCDVPQPEIQRDLDRAERSLHAGNLGEAESAYHAIEGCASVRDRVQDGLRLVRARKDAQKLSAN